MSLESIFPKERLSRDPSDLKNYGRDWLQHWDPKPSAIVFPVSTDEVAQIVKWARSAKMALVPSGGRTGVSGGAVALQGEVVVSFEKMNKILAYHEADELIEVEAGAVTKTIQDFAESKGMYFPVEFGATGSSQIGGNIATNAGGVRVVRYGNIRPWVAGLEVVTGAGDVISFNKGLQKNATGFDFRHLFIGSEGVLGFITKALLKVTRKPASRQVALTATRSLEQVLDLYVAAKKEFQLSAFEVFTRPCLEKVMQVQSMEDPFSQSFPLYVLLEIEKNESTESCDEKIFSFADKGMIEEATLSQSDAQFETLWSYRERISESLSHSKPYKNDISVRTSKIPELMKRVDQFLNQNAPHLSNVWFGHLGDGNVHVNILMPENTTSEKFVAECKKINEELFKIVTDLEGSISAEHGVGLTKKQFLPMSRAPVEIAAMREIKKIFDPSGIMNPGKIFDL